MAEQLAWTTYGGIHFRVCDPEPLECTLRYQTDDDHVLLIEKDSFVRLLACSPLPTDAIHKRRPQIAPEEVGMGPVSTPNDASTSICFLPLWKCIELAKGSPRRALLMELLETCLVDAHS